MIWTALIVMMIACVAQHLGLPQAVAMVLVKVAKCPKCLTFWLTLTVLLIAQCNILIAIMLAVVMAYLSYYWGIVILLLQKLYNRIWERLEEEK